MRACSRMEQQQLVSPQRPSESSYSTDSGSTMLHRPLGRRRLGSIIRALAKIFIGGGEASIHRSYSRSSGVSGILKGKRVAGQDTLKRVEHGMVRPVPTREIRLQ
jgi:hypothetical protein